jgi:hypothetical protein
VVVLRWVAGMLLKGAHMKQFRPLIVALLAVFALGAVMAAGASARKATPEILPVGGFTDKSGETQFAGKGIIGTSVIKCATSTSHGGFTNSLLGTFDNLYEKCLVKEPIVGLLLCTGLGDTANSSSILALGTFHLRYKETGTTTNSVAAFLIVPVHFTCVGGGMEVLVEVRGCVASEITPVNTSITLTGSPNHYTLPMKKSSEATRNEITKIASETGTTLETCALEAKQGSAAFSQSAQEQSDEIFPTSTTSEIMA